MKYTVEELLAYQKRYQDNLPKRLEMLAKKAPHVTAEELMRRYREKQDQENKKNDHNSTI